MPEKLGQVFLAQFSQFLADSDNTPLASFYNRICRLSIVVSTFLASFLILFAHPIMNLFGETVATGQNVLVILAIAFNIGNIGVVNSMLVVAKERTGAYLANNVILISFQFLTIIYAIEEFGMLGVAVGRLVGFIVGQVGLLVILRATTQLGSVISFPREYVPSQITVCLVALTLNSIENAVLGFILSLVVVLTFWKYIGFHPREFVSYLRERS